MMIAPDDSTLSDSRAAWRVQQAGWGGVARSFRGTLADNCKRFQFVGDGYKSMPAEQDGHFDIKSARHLNGPLLALLDQFTRYVHVIGATQVMKSLLGDIWAVYLLEHLCAALLVLFEDDPKADLYCQHRAIETVKSHPVLARMIAVANEINRFGTTGTRIKTPYSSMLVAGLNEGHVSSLSWQYIWISEAWQHPKDGLLFKAFKRTDRFQSSYYKILNESQASLADTDLHRAVKDVLQVPLLWRCPACDGEQSWEWRHWSYQRPDDFKPRPTKKISTVIIGGEAAIIETPPAIGSYAGMRIAENEDRKLSIAERARMAHWECIHCGAQIHDTKAEREAIAETYSQDYRTKQNGIFIPQQQVCFVLPFESNKDNRFEKTVTDFLQAKEAKELGNFKTWEDWFLKDRAFFYDPNQADRESRAGISFGTYETDPDKLMPNSHCRQVTADCGKAEDAGPDENRIGLFWFDIWEWDKASNGRQLSYGVVNSWELLAAQQRFWKVPSARTFVDCSWMPSQVEEAAVKFFELVPPDGLRDGKPVPQIPYAWKLAAGAGQNRRLTVPGQNRGAAYSLDSVPGGPRKAHDAKGKLWRMILRKLTWSNLWFEKQLDSILAHGVSVKLEFLARDKMMIVGLDGKPDAELTKWSLERCRDPLPDEKERGRFASYQSQLASRYFKEDTGKYEDYEKQSRPTEFRDTLLMQLAGVAPDGLLGHVGMDEQGK